MAYKTFGSGTYRLGSSIGSTNTTILLSSFTEPITDIPYTMSNLGTDIVYGTISPKSATVEFISFTGITQNVDGTATLTGVTRGLDRKTPYTLNNAFKLPHSGQSIFIISNPPQLYEKHAVKENDETITGTWEFDAVPTTISDPVSGDELARRSWVLSVVNGGPVSTDKLVEVGTAGETILIGQPIYLKAADGLWYKAIGTTASTLNNVQLGIAQGGGTVGNPITDGILRRGIDTNQSGGAAGDLGYISDTTTIATTTGTVERVIGNFMSATEFNFDPDFYYLSTADIKAASQGGGDFGTPSATNKFITEDYLTNSVPVTRAYGTFAGDETTRFDITNTAGNTYRYTYDGTGTNPNITALTFPTGYVIIIQSRVSQIDSANQGRFTITGSGTNYFELTNVSGVVESNKTLGGGYLLKYNPVWAKPVGLKYASVKLVGAGGNGDNGDDVGNISAAGGGAGGYSEKIIDVATLGSTETVTLGVSGGGTTSFGSHLQATGGVDAVADVPGIGGIGSGGDFNTQGQGGGSSLVSASFHGGTGGASLLGGGGTPESGVPTFNAGFGGGGQGGEESSNQPYGIAGPGTVILTEYF